MKCTESKGNEYWHTCMIKEEMKCTESKGSVKSLSPPALFCLGLQAAHAVGQALYKFPLLLLLTALPCSFRISTTSR